MAKWHQIKIDDEPLACHMGVTLGYLRMALGEIQQVTGLKDKDLRKMYTQKYGQRWGVVPSD